MSSDRRNIPCSEWAEKLAALHPGDLTATERDELRTHLASCRVCAQTYRDYLHLATLVQDLITVDVPADLLPGLPQLTAEQEETGIGSIPIVQPGITFSRPSRMPERRPWRVSRITLAAIAAVLVASVLLGSFALRVQRTEPAVVSQGRGPVSTTISQRREPVYYITPPGGPSKLSTPVITTSPAILSNPTPPFFIDGNVYRNSTVYRADTGAPVQQYLKGLGKVEIYNPRFVDGILYMAVRTANAGPGKMVMYAVRPGDGAVLWKWDNCGESVNMSPPTVANGAVYFICEATPNLYKLYALQARTGALLWLDTLPGEFGFDLLVNKHTLYIHQGNQLLAESANTGKLLWQRSFGVSDDYIEYAVSDNGVIYIAQEKAFFALQASDGKSVWEYHFSGGYYGPVPYVDQGVVYLFIRQLNEPVTIYALDGATGALHWQMQLMSNGNYGFPAIDHGNLYMVMNIFARSSHGFSAPIKRMLVAIRGSDGRILWQQDIPWNKGKLTFATIEPPLVSVGGGRIYLVDWQSAEMQNLNATMGAFSESNGALLWTRSVPQIW